MSSRSGAGSRLRAEKAWSESAASIAFIRAGALWGVRQMVEERFMGDEERRPLRLRRHGACGLCAHLGGQWPARYGSHTELYKNTP